MPSYDYECVSCNHTFEVFQSMFDDPIDVCPKCGKKVRRLITGGSGIIFKGSGFYVTDNKRSSGQAVSTKKKSESEDSTASDSKSGDKKSTEAKNTDKKAVAAGED